MLQSQKIINKCLVLSRYPHSDPFLEQQYVCNSVRIGQSLINEVPVERSILADFANYHILIIALMKSLIGPERIIYSL